MNVPDRVKRSAEFTFGNDARIHEGGQCKVGYNEERDDALVGGHPREAVQVETASRKWKLGNILIRGWHGALFRDSRKLKVAILGISPLVSTLPSTHG